MQRALALIHAGHFPQAEILCRQVLAREPQNFNALQLLGHIALRGCDYQGAVGFLAAAQSINPGSAPVHSNLAVALLALGRPREALESCDRALTLKAHYPEAQCNRGHACCALARPAEGLVSYEQAIALAPEFYAALAGRVNALLALRRYEQALLNCDRLLETHAQRSDVWCLRGAILLRLKRPEEALAAFDRALSIVPESPDVINNRGTALRDLRRPAEALAAYAQALRVRPEFAEVYCNVANIAFDAGRYEDALGHCDRALAIRPNFLDALDIRGTALRVLKRHAEAAGTYEAILATAPDYGRAQSHLLSARAQLCDWQQREQHIAAVVERLHAGDSASTPQAFLGMSDSPAAQLECARLYTAAEIPATAPLGPATATVGKGARYRHDRLRVAYLSADFRDHPVAHLIAGVLELHDRSRFETIGVSLQRSPAPGRMQARLRQAFDHFYDASEAGDREVALQLRDREVDIAVDLTGHTRGGRLGILACRPAPVQVNYLGFTGTSGADYVDYVIADGVAIPGEQERFFSERIVRMPYSFLPSDDRQPIAMETPARRDLGLPPAGFVFCAFNNPYKINPVMFDIWMRLLRETPGSVLWLRGGEAAMRVNLHREARARGVDAGRLVFAMRVDAMDEHLARYRQADLFLDTLPYGAHATARDALWAGLPVLTCAGMAFASRVAASLLGALQIPELVAPTLEEYAARALAFAQSPARLAEVRAKLEDQRATHPLFDTDLYRQHLESAYLTLWTRRQEGAAAASFLVPARR